MSATENSERTTISQKEYKEYLETGKLPWETDSKKNKYHADKCMVDGILFDSKKEANFYKELLILEKTGIISNIRRQVSYELIPTFMYRKAIILS